VVACQPDVVTVMIGTNDANATLMDENMKRYQRQMKLPRKADRAWYRLNLEKIVTVLKTRTRARIALISLPPIGEAMDHASYQRAAAYSRIVREVAERAGVAYIPLNESMDAYLRAHPHQPRISYDDNPRKLLYGVLASRFLMGKSWDEISRDRGLRLLTDTVHLNCRGAGMVADQIEKFVLGH
jgi:lysophospholipase L1-like esterase